MTRYGPAGRIDAAALRDGWGRRRVEWPAWADGILNSAIPHMGDYNLDGFVLEAVARVSTVPYAGGPFDEDMSRQFAARMLADWFAIACEIGFDVADIDQAVDLAAALMSVVTRRPPVVDGDHSPKETPTGGETPVSTGVSPEPTPSEPPNARVARGTSAGGPAPMTGVSGVSRSTQRHTEPRGDHPVIRSITPSVRRAKFAQRLAQAQTPMQQIAAASDYVRAVAGRLPEDEAARVAAEAVRSLMKIGDWGDGRPRRNASKRRRRRTGRRRAA